MLRVASAPAVAVAPVEAAVGAELQLAAVVVRREVLDEDELLRGGRERGGPVRAVLDDPRVAVRVGVVDVEPVGLRIGGVECDGEQSLLPSAAHRRPDVEERRRADTPVREHEDPAGLLDDVEPARLAGSRGGVDRRAEVRDADEVQRSTVAACDRRNDGEHEDDENDEPLHRAVKSCVFTHGSGGVRSDSACR